MVRFWIERLFPVRHRSGARKRKALPVVSYALEINIFQEDTPMKRFLSLAFFMVLALVCALIIAVVTYFISNGGLHIGRKLGEKLTGKAGILGGCILIFIGIEIFIRGVL